MKRCSGCKEYTLRDDKCPSCGAKLESAEPAKYSPEDRYGEYRRKLRVLERK